MEMADTCYFKNVVVIVRVLIVFYPVHLHVGPQAIRRIDASTRDKCLERDELQGKGPHPNGLQALNGLVGPTTPPGQHHRNHTQPVIAACI